MNSAPVRTSSLPLVMLLGALCALPPLSIDMGLPALPEIGGTFAVGTSLTGLTLSLFMAGFALTPIAFGALSDRQGRRPWLLVGLVLFAIGALAASVAPSIGWLLVARFVQGAGAGAGPTLAFAASRDTFSGPTLGSRLAVLTMLLNTAPVIAPTLGVGVLAVGGWRGIYAALTVTGIVLIAATFFGFAETLPQSRRRDQPFRDEFATALRILRARRDVTAAALLCGVSAASMFAYVSGSPLLLIGALGASTPLYAGLFAMTAGGIVCGAYISGRMLHRTKGASFLVAATALSLAAPAVALALLATGHASLPSLMPVLIAATFAFGLIIPAATHAVLDPVPEIAGLAAAIVNTLQMAFMSLSSLGSALLFPILGGSAIPIVMLAFAAVSAIAVAAIAAPFNKTPT